ncbi:MAG TPA: SpoIID/LytB domain-containing protein [Thermoanaerobaculia bacterium]|nr:SpoIID/LytB domain-containing protein [Thermoanaerobaculia bacterium]
MRIQWSRGAAASMSLFRALQSYQWGTLMKQTIFLAVTICIGLTRCASAPSRPQPTGPSATTSHIPQRASNALTPLSVSPVTIAPPLVRVGLLTDQSTATFGRVDGGYVVVSPAGASRIKRGFELRAPLAGKALNYAVLVAALSDRVSAEAMLKKVSTDTGATGRVQFDAAGGTYQVLLGASADKTETERLRGRLVESGFPNDLKVVGKPADATFARTLRLVDDEGDESSFTTDSVLVLRADGKEVSIGDQPYRGGARVFVSPRGLLNVINELTLEDYVRGVVPVEMGPKTYDEVEALKAQALAARTYVVRRLGEYRSEGYDICATPVCQVYKGFSSEDPLSDQAVRETAGMIITWRGKPIDALYTSTCGGETSDAETMFPDRTEPYLKRARCVELDLLTLNGRADSGPLNEMEGDSRLFQALAAKDAGDFSRAWSAREVRAAVDIANRLAGFKGAGLTTSPASSRRGDVLRYLDSVWGLARSGGVLTLPEDRKYFYPRSDSEQPVYESAAFLLKYRITPAQSIDRIDLNAAMPRDELYALLLSWLKKVGAITESSGKIAGVNGSTVTLKAEGKRTTVNLPAGIPILRKFNERLQEYQAAPVMIGDRITVLKLRDVPIGAVIQANYDGAAFDRTSSFSNWTRTYRADELARAISKRNPIKRLVDLQVKKVDASQRVATMDVIAEEGRVLTIRGLIIRWSLNLPDNLFTFLKSTDPDGVDRYTFFGKGWGHGVGMCQAGAYGMAFRGWTAEQIIKRFYTGVEITPMAAP